VRTTNEVLDEILAALHDARWEQKRRENERMILYIRRIRFKFGVVLIIIQDKLTL